MGGDVVEAVGVVQEKFDAIPNKVKTILDKTEDIVSDLAGLVSSVRDFGKTASGIGTKKPFKTYPVLSCPICNSSADDASSTADTLDTKAKDVVDTLDNSKTQALDAVNEGKKQVDDGIKSINDMVEQVLNVTELGDKPLDLSLEYTEQYKSNSQLGGLGAYAVWYLIVIATLAGTVMMAFNQVDAELPDERDGTGLGCIGKVGSCCVGCSWFFSFLVGSIMLVLATVFFFAIIGFGTTCMLVEDVTDNIVEYQGKWITNTTVLVFDVCWNGEDARKGLNIDQYLSKLDKENLGFDQLNGTDIIKGFDTPELDALKTEIDGLTVEGSFKFDTKAQTDIRNLCMNCCLQGFSGTCSPHFKNLGDYHTNCTAVVSANATNVTMPSCCSQRCDAEVQSIKDDLNGHIDELKAGVGAVITAKNDVVTTVKSFKDEMESVADLFAPIQAAVLSVVDTANGDGKTTGCNFVKTSFEKMENIMCTDVLQALITIVATMYVIGFLAGPLCCAGCCINKKCGGHGPIPEESIDLRYAAGKEIEFSNIDEKA